MACVEVLSCCLSGKTEENHKNLTSWCLSGIPPECMPYANVLCQPTLWLLLIPFILWCMVFNVGLEFVMLIFCSE